MAVASLVLGIISVAFCWFPWIGIPSGLVSLILGIVAMRDTTQTPQNRNMAIAGVVLGAIGILVSVILVIWALLFVKSIFNALDEGTLKEGVEKGLEELQKGLEQIPKTPPLF